MATLQNIIRGYMAERDRISSAWKLENSPLALPGQGTPPSMQDFATMMDKHTRHLMGALSGETALNPVEWEALLELLPNVRKLLGFTDDGYHA